MTEIDRQAIFSKLDTLAYRALDGATRFCMRRGHRQVEIAHWLVILLQDRDSDLWRIVRAYGLKDAKLEADLTHALDKLPVGATRVEGIASELDLLVERAWLNASLRFDQTKIRTGHLILGLLEPEFARVRGELSGQLQKLAFEQLVGDFGRLLADAPESAMMGPSPAESRAATADENGAPAPAVFGRQEALQRYSVDLTERARKGEIDPIEGREHEMRQVVDILMRRRQNNPILTGEAGVGKTAVVEGLALRIAKGDVPPPLQGVSLRALDIGLLQAGASMKGEFEQRLRQVIDEVQASPKPIILFIDEAHTLIGAGGAAGTGDAANLLKPALARGTLRTIAATTWAEYKKHIEKDPALTRRFQVVQVEEPAEDVALRMMRGVAATLETHHRVRILDEALEAAVKLSHRYIPARQLPDKAVSLLDTACARVAVSQHGVPAAVEDCRRQIAALETEFGIVTNEGAIGRDTSRRERRIHERIEEERARLGRLEGRWRSEKALVTRVLEIRAALASDALREGDERSRLLSELSGLEAELAQLQGDAPMILSAVDSRAVGAVVSDWTRIPVGRMVRDEIKSVLELAGTLQKRVIGQTHALELIARRIQTTRAGLEDPRKPIGVFLLAGPSGVGKTETALALAEALFGSEESLITINMSEFQEAHTVSTLKGAPPGYVGYGEGGVLTEAVRRRPYSVVLLDEVEKAHPDVHELFFQVFDKGSMEDGEGRKIDFKNTLILLTSNAGSDLTMQMCGDPELLPSPEALAKALRDPLLKVFPPALLGRMVTIPYYPLSDDMIRNIVRLSLSRVAQRMQAQHGIPLEIDDAVPKLIASRCTEFESGARMIESIIANTLLPRLSHEFLTRMMRGEPVQRARVSVSRGEAHCLLQ